MARTKVENHKTADLILECAEELFLEKGFQGASINDIAGLAKINKSLIYHHFTDKENLWKCVKERIAQRSANNQLNSLEFKSKTLEEFLESFIPFRFHLYAHHPELVQLMKWQKLESQSEQLSNVRSTSFANLNNYISSLQQAGQIRSDLKLDVIFYLIMSMSANGFLDNAPFLKTTEGQADYQKLIIESLLLILKPHDSKKDK